jgi:hypothetical protein
MVSESPSRLLLPLQHSRPLSRLSRRRPNAKPIDVDDEVLSSIGRSLLALAARPRTGRSAGNLSATLAARRARSA